MIDPWFRFRRRLPGFRTQKSGHVLMSESHDVPLGHVTANHSIWKRCVEGLIDHLTSTRKIGFALVQKISQENQPLGAASARVKNADDRFFRSLRVAYLLHSPNAISSVAAILLEDKRFTASEPHGEVFAKLVHRFVSMDISSPLHFTGVVQHFFRAEF